MTPFHFNFHLFTLIAFTLLNPLKPCLVLAQYAQDYNWINVPQPGGGYHVEPWWQPTGLNVPQKVLTLDPEFVILEYNCYYMRDICKNAANFYATPRGQARRYPGSFSYDFNTGKRKRSGKRRDKSCPTGVRGWKTYHSCPEPDQNIVMRHDGPWRFKALEPGTTMNNIMNDRNLLTGSVIYSKVRYTCDEFPPATWVEGGNGAIAVPGVTPGDSETRCAAMRCAKGVKAEQDWQGTSHGRLQQEIKSIIQRRQANFGHFPNWNPNDDVVMFGFRLANDRNSPAAARVYTYADPSLTQLQHALIDITQAKRSINSTHEYLHRLSTISIDELKKIGNVTEHHILAEDLGFTTRDFGEMSMPGMGTHPGALDLRWSDDPDNDEEYEDQDDKDVDTNDSTSGHTSPLGRYGYVAARKAETRSAKNTSSPISTPRVQNTTALDLAKARKIVDEAMIKSARLNKARLANPSRSQYGLQSEGADKSAKTKSPGKQSLKANDEETTPLLGITDEMVDAASLVSEADAVQSAPNITKRALVEHKYLYWMEHLKRKGGVPWGDDPSYKVFRNVLDYGAVGDGITDDTKAIKRAMNAGKRCGEKCHGSTTKNAIVYFPSGTYRVSSTIPLPFGTQVIGDPNKRPTILASNCFIGLGVLSTNQYTGNGFGVDGKDQEWFVTTGNFYRQIRNIRIDITQTPSDQNIAGLHYQVAQATSLQNIEIIAAKGSSQIGIFSENGSGGVISDVVLKGGAFGLYGGTQQFTAQRLTFDGCATGVQIIWDWGWVWKSIKMTNVQVGFRLLREGVTDEGHVGSAAFIDSSFDNVTTAILMAPPMSEPGAGSTGIVLDNVKFQGVGKAVADTNGTTLLEASGSVGQWAIGPVYSPNRDFFVGDKRVKHRRPKGLLNSKGEYFERAKPQYERRTVDDFWHVKDFGAMGDGKTDDTDAFQRALFASQGKVLFVDAGSYILTRTVLVPLGSKIVGEAWSQLVASGCFFEDASNPKVMLKVGNQGEVGNIEMQDLIFTSRGPTAGLIVLEWNVQAESPGSAGLWDCHVRIGGATGTELTPEKCPAKTDRVHQNCRAASLMMHVTPKASGYFENMWLWAADHMIDDSDLNDANNTVLQTSIYVARGLLIESIEPTWLYGTSSEHAIFYQYNFNKARNIFAGMLQTESPYFQPKPQAPSPYEGAVGVLPGDPNYNSCNTGDEMSGLDESWALIIRNSAEVIISGAGLYSWFSSYRQGCVDNHACQTSLVLLENNYANVQIQHLITIGTEYMVLQDGVGVSALDNLHVETHPRWSYIALFNVGGNQTEPSTIQVLGSNVWRMKDPQFTCSPPCLVQLPPWTGATSTVDYPRLTLTEGSWTTTITQAPITISRWAFDPLTIKQEACNCDCDCNMMLQAITSTVWPVLATTPSWPSVTYSGPNGDLSTTAPSVAFPTPPVLDIKNAEAPPKGNWPQKPVAARFGEETLPFDKECGILDPLCLGNNWWDIEPMPDAPEDPFDERGPEDYVTCPEDASTSTSIEPTSIEPDPEPTLEPPPDPPESSPMEIGYPRDNVLDCLNDGRKADHVRMDNSIKSFCNSLGVEGDILSDGFAKARPFDFDQSGLSLPMAIDISFNVEKGCKWNYNFDECSRYLHIPVDACDCGGVDGKQGGEVKNSCYRWRIDPRTVH